MTTHLSQNARRWAGLDKSQPQPTFPITWSLAKKQGCIHLIVQRGQRQEYISWPASIPMDARMRRTMRGALHILREKIKLPPVSRYSR